MLVGEGMGWEEGEGFDSSVLYSTEYIHMLIQSGMLTVPWNCFISYY